MPRRARSKQSVVKVPPGQRGPPPGLDAGSGWYYSQIHTKRCITNEDCYLDLSPWSEDYR